MIQTAVVRNLIFNKIFEISCFRKYLCKCTYILPANRPDIVFYYYDPVRFGRLGRNVSNMINYLDEIVSVNAAKRFQCTVFNMINTVYHDNPLIFIELRFGKSSSPFIGQ